MSSGAFHGISDVLRRFPGACLLLSAFLLPAQQVQLGGPVCGVIYDAPTRSLRPLLGVPGAAYLGGALVAGVDFASVAPSGKLALAVKDGQALLLTDLDRLQPAVLPLPAVLQDADRAAWAQDSSALALYSSARGWLQRVTGLDGAPVAGPPMEVSFPGGSVTLIATSHGAERIVLGVRGEISGGLYLIPADGPPLEVASMADPGAVFFPAEGRTLYAVDRHSRRVLAVHNFPPGEVVTLLEARDGVADPVGIAVSGDGQRLFLADRSSRSVRVYEVSTRTLMAEVPLEAAPSLLQPLRGNALFLLNSGSRRGEPLFLLDARSAPAVYFVPASEQD